METSIRQQLVDPHESHRGNASTSNDNTGGNFREICKFYSKFNYCQFGNRCKFAHPRKTFGPRQYYRSKIEHRDVKSVTDSKRKHATQRNPQVELQLSESESNGSTSKPRDILNNSEISGKNITKPKKRPCRYFKMGHCKAGDSCSFNHQLDCQNIPSLASMANKRDDAQIQKTNISTKKKSVPVCRFYRKGFCERGDQCKFYHLQKYSLGENKVAAKSSQKTENNDEYEHPIAIDENEVHNQTVNAVDTLADQLNKDVNVSSKFEISTSHSYKPTNPQFTAKNIFDLSATSQDCILKLRDTEINQLKRRFPKLIETEENAAFSFEFQSSDPDWPFDIKCLQLEVVFPENYPVEVCKINVLKSEICMPEMLIRYLNRSIESWLSSKHDDATKCNQLELIFRSFLRWFDKNLEDLFVCGLKKVKQDMDAKKSGIEYVPVEELFPSQCNTTNATPSSDTDISETILLETSTSPQEHSNKDPNSTDATRPTKKPPVPSSNALNQGIKIMFTGLEFIEGVGALSCTKLSVALNCSRCKTSFNETAIPSKNRASDCSKCSRKLECNLASLLLHQFSNVLGTLYLTDCRIVDVNLVDCSFLADCLNCSKQVPIKGIHYGQKQKFWCMFCNQKFIITIEGVRFQALKPTYSETQNATVKKKEKAKDPLIKEGEPLPLEGTCKHYKKSFRWLRFPCCGRVYPCDICHDEKESGHEMKFASRMICGFCSKEQPYSKDKPCFACASSVVAKGGAHWEGGKGCRNKIKMSRDDKHKYVGINKTVSKKAETSKTTKKK